MKQKEKIKFRHLTNLYNIDVIQGVNVGRSFPKHAHEGICVGVINRGTRVYSIGKRETYVESGKSFIINKEEVHSFTALATTPHDYLCMCFDASYFENALSETNPIIPGELFFKDNVIQNSYLYTLINRFCRNLLDPTTDLQNEDLFFKIIEELIINHSNSAGSYRKTGSEQRAIKQMKDYIEDNYKYNISTKELSQISGLSSYYLIRLFSNMYGFAPHCYQNNIRIKKVKQLLINRKMAMTDIALEVGFVDQSHMIKQFKKSVGITPSQYFQEMKK